MSNRMTMDKPSGNGVSNPLSYKVGYHGSKGPIAWEGRCVESEETLQVFIRDTVQSRMNDDDSSFDECMSALATTGMATEFVEKLLKTVPEPTHWEVGEAFAECSLKCDPNREVHWPWNTVRDRRTPRASLPGSDLVGFFREGDEVWLLFGEVKTSSDKTVPPNVMLGSGGLTWQLEENACRLDIQCSLLKWLCARCQTLEHRDLFEKAVRRYLESQGRQLYLVGILLRDTPPDEKDVRSRATALSTKLSSETRAVVIAWYLPTALANLPKYLAEGASP